VLRYAKYEGVEDGSAASVRWSVVPTPVQMSINVSRPTVTVQRDDGWVVVQPSTEQLSNEAQYLAGPYSLALTTIYMYCNDSHYCVGHRVQKKESREYVQNTGKRKLNCVQ